MGESDYSGGLVQMHDLKCLTTYLKLYSKKIVYFFCGAFRSEIGWLIDTGRNLDFSQAEKKIFIH